MKRVVLCLLAVAMTTSVAKAETLSGNLAADNAFYAYLSTSSVTPGTPIASIGGPSDTGNYFWQQTIPITPLTLTAGTTYYLQVEVFNWGGPGGLLGSFSLSDPSLEFQNGTQSLNSDTADWTYSYTGFGDAALLPNGSQGLNGVGPWGLHSGISGGAEWIWDPNTQYTPDLYFETEITTAPAPEPASLTLLGTGLLALGSLVSRRRRRA